MTTPTTPMIETLQADRPSTSLVITAARWAAALLLPALLASCGGGGSGDDPSIAVITANPTAYGRAMTITVAGSGLSKGILLTIGGCDGLAKVAGGNDVQQQYSCRVSAVGALRPTVTNAVGQELASLGVLIPPPQVTVVTSLGSFIVQLDPDKAPKTVNNFLNYVNGAFYNSTIFHRVIDKFVIQAGGFTTGPKRKTPTLTAVPLESNNGLLNLRGTIAMARLEAPNSAQSEFYINVADNPKLDYASATSPGYAVFGALVSGLDTVDAIKVVPTHKDTTTGLEDVPDADVTILSAFQNQ